MPRWEKENPSKKTADHRKWREKAGEEYKKQRREYAKKWRAEHKEIFKATQKRAYDKMRYECLEHYSKGKPKCACCGEEEILFLHIDHINGDGAEHRRILKKELGYYPGGNNLPYWLKKNNYPKGFQILCANCNLGKRLNAECPHKVKKLIQ